MILTCPNCATKFRVPDGALGATGRLVRCGNCGTEWTATEDVQADIITPTPQASVTMPPPPAETYAPDPGPLAPDPLASLEEDGAYDAPVSADEIGADSDDYEVPDPEVYAPVDDPPPLRAASSSVDTVLRSNVPAMPRKRRRTPGAVIALGWLLLVALYGTLGAAVVFYNEPIAQAWPPSQPLFDALGVNKPKRQIAENISDVMRFNIFGDPDRRADVPGYFLIADVQSQGSQLHRLPKLEAVIFNSRGQALQRIPMSAESELIEPGQTVRLEAHVRVPPDGAARWEVREAEQQ